MTAALIAAYILLAVSGTLTVHGTWRCGRLHRAALAEDREIFTAWITTRTEHREQQPASVLDSSDHPYHRAQRRTRNAQIVMFLAVAAIGILTVSGAAS